MARYIDAELLKKHGFVLAKVSTPNSKRNTRRENEYAN